MKVRDWFEHFDVIDFYPIAGYEFHIPLKKKQVFYLGEIPDEVLDRDIIKFSIERDYDVVWVVFFVE